MEIKLINKYYRIQKVLKKSNPTEISKVLLPENYEKQEDFEIVQLVDRAFDCFIMTEGHITYLIVDSKMIEEIKVLDETILLIKENYVKGYFRNDIL